MTDERRRALSEVLDQLESSVHGESITISEVIEKLGHKSFASLMLVFSLISPSPASAIPGITTVVAVIVFPIIHEKKQSFRKCPASLPREGPGCAIT